MPDERERGSVNVSVALDQSRLAVDRLRALLDGIDPEDIDPVAFLELLATSGVTMHEFRTATQAIGAALNLSSAKDRLRAYLLLRVGEVVSTYELNGVSGIQESPRRIRELRVEEGMDISAGPAGDLRPGEYRLEETEADLEKARFWKTRNSIRRMPGSMKDRCLKLLQTIYPLAASKEDLAYVAKGQEWPRRMRELEEDGWDVVSSVDDPSMPIGSYRLGTTERGTPRSREAIKQRTAILRRDDYTCRDCGKSPSGEPGTVLQVHHLHQVQAGGTNDDDNLVTLCTDCHAGRHANDGIARASDELLQPGSDPWH